MRLSVQTKRWAFNLLLFLVRPGQGLDFICEDLQVTEPLDIEPVANTLVVEDDANILNLLSAYLESAGHRVVTASDGAAGLQKALNGTFDICVFDEMLPNRSGTEIAEAMRNVGNATPILFLSALSAEKDVLRGFSAGADDYVVKPFSPRELLVRVDAILRRSSNGLLTNRKKYCEGPVQLDEDQPTCHFKGKSIELTPHEYRILRQLLSQPNRVFERATLISALYGNEHAVSPKAIDVHMHHLRAKLGSEAGAMIKTVRGFGYKFSLPNSKADADAFA